MRVYRVEHSEHPNEVAGTFSGPYGLGGVCSSRDWTERLHKFPSHPSPNEDEKLRIKIKEFKTWPFSYVCGFSTLKQLHQWFTNEELKKLHGLGFVLATYETKKVLKGSTQTLFEPQTKRTYLSLETLF